MARTSSRSHNMNIGPKRGTLKKKCMVNEKSAFSVLAACILYEISRACCPTRFWSTTRCILPSSWRKQKLAALVSHRTLSLMYRHSSMDMSLSTACTIFRAPGKPESHYKLCV